MEFIDKTKKFLKRVIVEDIYNINSKKNIYYNINLDLCKIQKRVAFVYLNTLFENPFNEKEVYHVNRIHVYQLLKPFIEFGYIIDVYPCENLGKNDFFYDVSYDIIFGFGPTFVLLSELNSQAYKILFVTENAPWIVKDNYNERLKLFNSRNGRIPHRAISRTNFYTKEMFEISNVGICINGTYNLNSMKEALPYIYQINVNSIYDGRKVEKDHTNTKNSFLWFGSTGLIHKGLDILIDVIKDMPHCSLDIYGASSEELLDIKLPENVHNCGKVNIHSKEFLEEVVAKHTFVVSLSCSEGMQSGIATCMNYGLIPILTKETGYDDNPYVLQVDNINIVYLTKYLEQCINMDTCYLKELECLVQDYSLYNYNLDFFTNNFNNIITKILINEN